MNATTHTVDSDPNPNMDSDDRRTLVLQSLAETRVWAARWLTDKMLSEDDDPQRRVVEEVVFLKQCEGPDILRGRSDAVVAMFVGGPNCRFQTENARHELDADGNVVKAKVVNEAEYEALCEPSGNGHWIHRPSRTMAEKASVAAISVRFKRAKRDHDARRERQLRKKKAREALENARRDERKELNATAPAPAEVLAAAPALQFAVARIAHRLTARVDAGMIHEEVDRFYALPEATSVDTALDAAADVDDEHEVALLLDASVSLGKRKRSPTPSASAGGPVAGSSVAGVVGRVVEPKRPRSAMRGSTSGAPKRGARFPSALAIDDDGLIWPTSETSTTGASLREPLQIAEAINEMPDELFDYLVGVIDERVKADAQAGPPQRT